MNYMLILEREEIDARTNEQEEAITADFFLQTFEIAYLLIFLNKNSCCDAFCGWTSSWSARVTRATKRNIFQTFVQSWLVIVARVVSVYFDDFWRILSDQDHFAWKTLAEQSIGPRMKNGKPYAFMTMRKRRTGALLFLLLLLLFRSIPNSSPQWVWFWYPPNSFRSVCHEFNLWSLLMSKNFSFHHFMWNM